MEQHILYNRNNQLTPPSELHQSPILPPSRLVIPPSKLVTLPSRPPSQLVTPLNSLVTPLNSLVTPLNRLVILLSRLTPQQLLPILLNSLTTHSILVSGVCAKCA